MQSLEPINPDTFISLVQPLLERMDLQGLHDLLKSHWKAEQLQQLMTSEHTDAKKVALLAIGLVGRACCLPELSKHLKDPDPVVHAMTEHAMWNIWFRMGATPEANHQLARGAQALERKEYEHALKHFNDALELDPEFAEAYNQRALANYLLERYEDSIEDCRRTVQRMPMHFGALAGLGHCYAHLGKLREAIDSYQRALAIHPHMDCLNQAIPELRARLRDKSSAEH
ncbi:MAG TPA: tetratricopeptide repeat protein [Tepidisphaeraceae bacterium]|nr:tetratricopeptide repeat protein [Tepidisphaeraceae bacterium]